MIGHYRSRRQIHAIREPHSRRLKGRFSSSKIFCSDRCASICCCYVSSPCRCIYSRLRFGGSFLKKIHTGFWVCSGPGTIGALHNPLLWETAAAVDVLPGRCLCAIPTTVIYMAPIGVQPQSLCVVNRFIDNYKPFRRYFSKSPSRIRDNHALSCDTAVPSSTHEHKILCMFFQKRDIQFQVAAAPPLRRSRVAEVGYVPA